ARGAAVVAPDHGSALGRWWRYGVRTGRIRAGHAARRPPVPAGARPALYRSRPAAGPRHPRPPRSRAHDPGRAGRRLRPVRHPGRPRAAPRPPVGEVLQKRPSRAPGTPNLGAGPRPLSDKMTTLDFAALTSTFP